MESYIYTFIYYCNNCNMLHASKNTPLHACLVYTYIHLIFERRLFRMNDTTAIISAIDGGIISSPPPMTPPIISAVLILNPEPAPMYIQCSFICTLLSLYLHTHIFYTLYYSVCTHWDTNWEKAIINTYKNVLLDTIVLACMYKE